MRYLVFALALVGCYGNNKQSEESNIRLFKSLGVPERQLAISCADTISQRSHRCLVTIFDSGKQFSVVMMTSCNIHECVIDQILPDGISNPTAKDAPSN